MGIINCGLCVLWACVFVFCGHVCLCSLGMCVDEDPLAAGNERDQACCNTNGVSIYC